MSGLDELQQAGDIGRLAQAIEKLAEVLDKRLAELTETLRNTRQTAATETTHHLSAEYTPNTELVEEWARKIGRTCESRILKLLAEKYPLRLTRAEIAAQLRYSKNSGPFKQAIATLKKHQLITEDNEGRLTLHQNLLQ